MKKTICIVVLSLLCICLGTLLIFNNDSTYVRDVYHEQLESKYYFSREGLASEVERYIKKVAPTAVVDPLLLVDLCSEYNVDIRFVLAQGHIESHFGTKGTAVKTNSIFNVGAYDGHSAKKQIKNGFGYKHPNYSIEPYLKLLTSEYLVDKTEYELMENFVNTEGKRYASNKKYENLISEKFRVICTTTNITNLYNTYMTRKILLEY
jgi:hypothetical protein